MGAGLDTSLPPRKRMGGGERSERPSGHRPRLGRAPTGAGVGGGWYSQAASSRAGLATADPKGAIGEPGEPRRGQAGNRVAGREEAGAARTPHARPRPCPAFGGPRQLHKRPQGSRRDGARAEEAPPPRLTLSHTHTHTRSPPSPHLGPRSAGSAPHSGAGEAGARALRREADALPDARSSAGAGTPTRRQNQQSTCRSREENMPQAPSRGSATRRCPGRRAALAGSGEEAGKGPARWLPGHGASLPPGCGEAGTPHARD